jgi:hypothetical protein
VDGLTGELKFAPNLPLQHDDYRVQKYVVRSRLENSGHWVEVGTKTLSPEECVHSLEQVTIPLRLVDEEVRCVYQVELLYQDVEQPVKSEDFEEVLKPTGEHPI